MGFKKVEPISKGFKKVEPETIDVEEQNPIVKGLKEWINEPKDTVSYVSGTGLTQREITPEMQSGAREALASYGLGFAKMPLNRVTNLYNDPDIKSLMSEHKISAGAGELTRDLLLLKGLGLAFRGLATVPAVAKVADGFTKAEAVKRISESSALGKRFLNFYEVERYVGHALTNAATFGAYSAIKEMGDPYEGQSFLTAASRIGAVSAWGAGLGVVSSVPSYVPRVVSAGVYGAATTLMSGGSVEDATYNAALMAGFTIISGKGVDRNIQNRAISNIKKETYNYLVKTGIDPVSAEKQASTAISQMIKNCGGIENVLKNNPAENMNFVASEIRKLQPKYTFKAPKQMTAPEVLPPKPKAQPTEGKPQDFKTAEEYVASRTTGYHGTTAGKDVTQLKPSDGGELGPGVYFSRDINVAKRYGTPDTREISPDKFATVPLDIGNLRFKRMTMKEFQDLRNSYFEEQSNLLTASGKDRQMDWTGDNYRKAVDKFEADIKKEGFDGIYVTEAIGGDQGVVFPDSVNKIKTKSQLISEWEAAQKSQPTEGKVEKPEKVIAPKEKILPAKPEEKKIFAQVMKERLKEIKSKFITEKGKTRAEIKEIQSNVTDAIKDFDIPLKDKAKMMSSIKNANTVANLYKTLNDLSSKADFYVSENKKTELKKQISEELASTKPVKKGQRKVGKFLYEDNKLFDELRRINKLTTDAASLELDVISPDSQENILKIKMLEYKSIGKKEASPELYESLYNDIIQLKDYASQAKDFDDFIKILNRQNLVDDAMSDIEKIESKEGTVSTNILNMYRKGFSNTWSMLNSIGGKKFADKYNTELIENQRDTDIYFKTEEMTDTAKKIYDEKNVFKVFEKMGVKEFQITDNDGLTTDLDKMQLIDIYNSVKNEQIKKRYYDTFGEEQINAVLANMDANDILFADYLMDVVGEYRDIHNLRNIEITGRDLGYVENYWMATSEHQQSVFDDIKIQGETPSAMKERARGKVIPVPKNAWYKAQRHIAQAEHVKTVSREYENLKRLFSDRKLKKQIETKFGEDIYRTLIDQIDLMSLNRQTAKADAISNVFGQAVNNWVTSKIAINPTTFVRQLVSVGNYMENIPVTDWTAGFFEGIANPEKTFKFMWDNAPFLKARFNKGYSEALRDVIEGAGQISVNKNDLTKFLTSFTRAGDITAIIYGGYPMIKAGKSFKDFELATLRAQQSALSSSRSMFQNSENPFAKLFLRFKNTPVQYMRKMVDAGISYYNGDINSTQFAKTMTIYGVIQPALYILAGAAVTEGFKKLGELTRGDKLEDIDTEKLMSDILINILVSPVNAIPVLDDISAYIARRVMGKKAWKVFSTPLLDDIESGVQKMTKKKITGKDYFDIAASILEPSTGLPIKTPIRYFELLKGKKKKRRF